MPKVFGGSVAAQNRTSLSVEQNIFSKVPRIVPDEDPYAGTVDYLKDVLRGAKKPKKLKQFKTAAFKIRMDCDGCVRRAKNTLQKMKGVKSVDIDRKLQKVTVSGYIEGPKLLKRFTDKTKMRAQIWPYVPFQTVPDPHTSLAYDKKAPPNHVKRVDPSATTKETTLDPQFLTMFSDDNTNACTIM